MKYPLFRSHPPITGNTSFPAFRLPTAAVLAALAWSVFPTARGADIAWDGVAPGPFTTATNWDGDVVPGATDNALIANGGEAQIVTGNTISLNNLEVLNGTVTQTGGSVAATGTADSPSAYYIGGTSGQTGTYTVSGSSTLTGGKAVIGENGGTGVFTLSGGSTYTGDLGRRTDIGNGAGSTGTLNVQSGAQWLTNDWLIVGRGGSGTLNLSGTGSSVTANGNIYVGDTGGGSGTATISSGGTLSGGTFIVANGGSTGALTVQDAATTISVAEFFVGNNGGSNGTVDIQGGSVTASSWVVIGRFGGTGAVTLKGTSSLTKTGGGNFAVGDGFNGASNGTLTIQDSATLNVQSGELWVGAEGDAGTVGVLNVNGGEVDTSNWVAIGRNHTTGTLNITNGTFNVNAVGSFSGGPNFTTEGSTTANAIINQSGGVFNNLASDTILGESNGSVAVWNATGGTSTHNVLRLGGNGGSTGTLNVSGTAQVNATSLFVSSNGGSTGILNLNGGTLSTGRLEKGAGAATVSFDGGTLQASADTVLLLQDFSSGDVTVKTGGLKVDTNGHAATMASEIGGQVGDGGLTKLGAGTLTLSAAESYQGATVVQAGTLLLSGSLTASTGLNIANGATFQLQGTGISLNDTINLTLVTGSNLNLDFTGTETIGALFVNGTPIAIGTYTAGQLAGLSTGANFTGTGSVQITAVPEPGTVALVIAGLGVLLYLRPRTRRS